MSDTQPSSSPRTPRLDAEQHEAASGGLRGAVHEVIFEADTPAGKAFDVGLFLAIAASIVTIMLESVAEVGIPYRSTLRAVEWALTGAFTLEYLLRLWCVKRPWRYATSFFGVVDLLAVVPTYVGLFFSGGHYLLMVRALRLLRVFRVLKLSHYLGEAQGLQRALQASVPKITVFLGFILTVTLIIGAAMYVIEGPESGFTSIPRGVYWAVVTLTTVGYGDIAPRTVLGQAIAGVVMILGYGVLAVPTGIVSAEMSRSAARGAEHITTQVCPACSREGHDPDARFCKHCGGDLSW